MAEPKKGGDSAMRIDAALVQELAELLAANELTEIEVEDGDRKIRVARQGAAVAAAPAYVPTAPAAAADPAAAPAAAAPAAEQVPANAVKSPMVGTAYLSAEPGGEPFVAAGKSVKAGDTLMIIEAMKVMNPIVAPDAGVVKQVLVSDGQPVEFDQPLVVIG